MTKGRTTEWKDIDQREEGQDSPDLHDSREYEERAREQVAQKEQMRDAGVEPDTEGSRTQPAPDESGAEADVSEGQRPQ